VSQPCLSAWRCRQWCRQGWHSRQHHHCSRRASLSRHTAPSPRRRLVLAGWAGGRHLPGHMPSAPWHHHNYCGLPKKADRKVAKCLQLFLAEGAGTAAEGTSFLSTPKCPVEWGGSSFAPAVGESGCWMSPNTSTAPAAGDRSHRMSRVPGVLSHETRQLRSSAVARQEHTAGGTGLWHLGRRESTS